MIYRIPRNDIMLGFYKDYETDETVDLHTILQDASGGEIRNQLISDPWSIHRHNENGLLPIHQVVQRDADDINDLIDLFLSHNADINGKTVVEGDTPLHVLVKNVPVTRALPTAKKLLTCGADPMIRNKNLRSAYDYAIQKGQNQMVEILSCEKWHMDPMAIITAVTRGTMDDIKKVIRLGGDVNMKTEISHSPIHYVITQRYKQDKQAVIELLVKHKANMNSQTEDKNTVLHLAIMEMAHDNELYTLVSYLLKIGVESNIKNKNKQAAIDIAIDKQYEDIITLLGGRSLQSDLKADFFEAVKKHDVDTTTELLSQDRSVVRAFTENGLNALHLAAIQNPYDDQIAMIDTLLAGRADINVQTLKKNDTPLHLAAKEDNVDVIKCLLHHKADPERKNLNGRTPYEEAADREFIKSMEAFEQYYDERSEVKDGQRRNRKQPRQEEKKKSGTCTVL